MRAVVMAGGEGSRLRPITFNRPKPLVPVANRPIMAHILDLLALHGCTDIVATLHYLADEIQGYFGDGADYGVRLHYSIEDSPLGTAGSVRKASDLLRDGTFAIVSGDALTDCDLSAAVRFHRQKGALATLVLYRVPNPLEFGIVITDDEGRVQRFYEKPGWSEVFSDTVNTGIYILEPEVLDMMEPRRPYDWSQDIFPRLLAEGAPMYGYVMDGYWCDIGTLAQYRDAQEHALTGQARLTIPSEEVHPGIFLGANTVVDDSAVLVPPVLVGRNSRIKRNARIGPYTVIGDNCLIEEGAHVERSVMWDSCYVGNNVGIHSATVCSRVTIKRDTNIREEAVIGDRCLIDVGCTIRPRIKLWPDKIIERGSTVTMSLVWGNKWRGSIFRDLGVAGLSNIEITPEFATRLGLALGSVLQDQSRVITARDSSRSSRMIKRSIISSLLSAGCDVVDMHSMPVPVTRHHVRAVGATAAMNVRKLPGSTRVSLVEFFDGNGAYISRSLERKVEAAFFREEFHRIDSEELGMIEEAGRAVEMYQNDFFKLLPQPGPERRLRIVCDYGYSSISAMFPAMLARLGVDSISINGYNDAKLAPRGNEQKLRHIENLRQIVGTLGYDMGVLVTDEGERLTVVDDKGRVLLGNTLFATLCLLVAKTIDCPTIAMSVTAPSRLEEVLQRERAVVIRTRSSVRDLMNSVQEGGITFAGDEQGGFIFPSLHPGFDAMFSLANLLLMLRQTGLNLSELVSVLPEFHLAYDQVHCPWESKGSVMRRMAEEHKEGDRVELVDGIKIFDRDSWVLVLPDSFEPVFHVYAESPAEAASKDLVDSYVKKIESMRVPTAS